jgi:hypothetical protein
MKRSIIVLIIGATGLWIAFAAVLIGNVPSWLPTSFSALARPTSFADLGQSFSLFDGLFSSLALVLGLTAVLIQIRQQADSNVIGAFSARQQFLIAECDRLEQQIQSLKNSEKVDTSLFTNMVEKKKRLLDESKKIDGRLKELLNQI